MNILEELFYGNLKFHDQPVYRDSKHGKSMTVIARNEEILLELLEGKEKSRFIDLMNAYDESSSISDVENFITGFQIGARFIFDTFIIGSEHINKDE